MVEGGVLLGEYLEVTPTPPFLREELWDEIFA